MNAGHPRDRVGRWQQSHSEGAAAVEEDPASVDASWDTFFRNFTGQAATNVGLSGQTIQESMRLLLLVRAYQVNGHMKAKLDPLALDDRKIPQELDPALYGFNEADLDREFFLGVWRMAGFLSENRPVQTLRAILSRCVGFLLQLGFNREPYIHARI